MECPPNRMSSSDLEVQIEVLQSAAFQQIQECGDIISSILIVVKFIQENNMTVGFDLSKLRQIALRSVDGDTNTYLWHINALIAASSDFEHLLLGIEMMFDRFLGSAACFIKERQKRQGPQDMKQSTGATQSNQFVTPLKMTKPKFLGNEIVSFVNSFYDDRADADPEKRGPIECGLSVVTEDMTTPNPRSDHSNDENQNQNSRPQHGNQLKVEENEEFMQKYRGKLSSPISFRMRQQKRMMQSERRGSQCNSRNVSMLEFNDSMSDLQIMEPSFVQPDVQSPFNVSKFAQTVDLGAEDGTEEMQV